MNKNPVTGSLKGSFFMYTAGVVLGSVYSVAAMLLFSINPYLEYNLTSLFIQKLFFLTVPPVFLLFILLFLVSNNKLVYKVTLYPGVLAGFYSVYSPFTILSYNKVLSFYPLFVEPLVFLLMLITIENALNGITSLSSSYSHPAKYVFFSLILLLSICLPALIQAFWIMGFPAYSLLLLLIGSAALCTAARLISPKRM